MIWITKIGSKENFREGNKLRVMVVSFQDCHIVNLKQHFMTDFILLKLALYKNVIWTYIHILYFGLLYTYIWERPAETGHRARAVPFSRKRRSV